MSYRLARPILWWRGGCLRLLSDHHGLSTYEQGLLMRLGHLLYYPVSHPTYGDYMSNDHSSALRLVIPPVTEPVTLAQAKSFLRIEHSGDDAAITTAIVAARVMAEHYLRLILLAQTWEFSVGNPCTLTLMLPVQPVSSVVSVTLVNEQGAPSVLGAQYYRLSVDGRALLFTNPLQSEIVKVQLVAGAYTDVQSIPAPLVQGILHHVAALLEQRDGAAGLPLQSIQCYAPFRRISL